MRVLCLSNMWPSEEQPDYGSFVERMCHALESRGHEVTVAAITERRGGPARTPLKYGRLAREAARCAMDADVVYAHYLFPTGAIAARAGRRGRIPWVLTAHGGDVANLSRAPVLRATGPAVRDASAVIAVSRYLAGELRDAGLEPRELSIVNMGVDLERFAPADRAQARRELRLPHDGEIVLAVGGLTARKSPLTLIQAVASLRRRRPGARLALVGAGPLEGAARAGAARLGVPLDMPGAVAHSEVARWMAAASVLAMTSKVEPLGQVALEALASGRPVVATAVGGAPEVVPGRGAGRVVDPLDPGAIARGLEEILGDPPSAAECRRAAEPHSLAHQAARVEGVLARAILEGDSAGA